MEERMEKLLPKNHHSALIISLSAGLIYRFYPTHAIVEGMSIHKSDPTGHRYVTLAIGESFECWEPRLMASNKYYPSCHCVQRQILLSYEKLARSMNGIGY